MWDLGGVGFKFCRIPRPFFYEKLESRSGPRTVDTNGQPDELGIIGVRQLLYFRGKETCIL
jgi:hypothetical protein